MENVKPKRSRTPALLTLLAVLCLAAAAVWFLFFRDTAYITDSTAHVDGSITQGDDAVATAAAALPEADPADVIADGENDTPRVALVFVGLTEEADTNHAVLNLVQKSDVKASFALSAAEGLEYTDFVADLKAGAYPIISNGAAGESNLQNKATTEMVNVMLKSRQTLENAADEAVPLLYCSSTALTGEVLRAARVSGYEAVLSPDAAHVLTANSFAATGDAYRFVSGLQGDSIVIIDLRGTAEAIQDEDTVVAEKPAVDKMPDLDTTATPETAEKVPVLVQVQWLLDALAEQGLSTEYVSNFARTDGLLTLQSEAEDPLAEKTAVYRSCLTDKNQAGLGVAALPAADEMDAVLSALDSTKVHATFFATPDEVENRAADLQRLADAGCTLGITLPADELNGQTGGEIFTRLYTASHALGSVTGSSGLVLADADYTADTLAALRAAAKVLNLRVTQPDSPETMQAGALYLLPAYTNDDAASLQTRATDAGVQLVDLATAIANSGSIPSLTPTQVNALRKQNDGQMAEMQRIVYTTERAVSFAFYGLSNTNVALDAVDRLQAHGGKGTFFASLDELMNCSTAIEYALAAGDDIGIYYKADSDYPQSYTSVLNYLNSWKTYANWRYGVDSDVVLMPSDDIADATGEAISTMGCRLIRNTFSVVKAEDTNLTPDDVSPAMEHISSMRVMRGSFVLFNMNFYINDTDAEQGHTTLGAVLDVFIENHIDTLAYHEPLTDTIEDASRFTITTARAMLDSDAQYTFCDEPQTDIALDKNVLTNLPTDAERFEEIAKRYYGNIDINAQNKLPGFTQSEINKLDKDGNFTNDKVLFLTFDDWGTEQSINKLLYVLEKHNVKATFFIRTNYIDSNPNLLRAIAQQGHEIASHTNGHMPLADSVDEEGTLMASLTEEEAQTLREDLVTSYNKLHEYVGNVEVDGKPALSRIFRPPTLAVSRIGLTQVFDVGYTYSVSGGYSIDDYETPSYEATLSLLKYNNIGNDRYITVSNGSVIVMHMQENAKYTAQALDTMIPIWQAEGYSFARIDDYLGD